MDGRYLTLGLDALSRAHAMDFFADGHRGGAILSAYFLCREGGVEPGTDALLAAMIDRDYGGTPLCASLPEEAPDPALTHDLAETLRTHATGLRKAGHNVILPALALKAFHHAPALITPARVAGIRALVECFQAVDDADEVDDAAVPGIDDTADWADFVLRELLRTFEAFDGRGQGWSGHLLTYSRALLDLRDGGYDDTAEVALQGWRCYLRRIRKGPLETDRPRPEHAATPLRPGQRAYWEARHDQPLGLGHLIKYPYGYRGIAHRAGDKQLVARCDAAAYRIF